MNDRIAELVTYTAASAAALAVDVGLLVMLVTLAGWQYMPAAATSFVAGGIFLYVLSITFVFGFRRLHHPVLELPVFLGLGLVGLVVNAVVMFVAVEAVHAHFMVAKAGAAMCTFGINFLLRRNLMFSRVPQPD